MNMSIDANAPDSEGVVSSHEMMFGSGTHIARSVRVDLMCLMASTLTNVLIHFVFSTKRRDDLIRLECETDLKAYVGGLCRTRDSPLLAMGGTANHVHMVIALHKTISVSDLMRDVKRESCLWLKERSDPRFQWQDGYFAHSVSPGDIEVIFRYIAIQKEHHRRRDFKDEVRAMCRKYGLDLNEKFAWD
jgi:REP element-mobilizing transposase RayT